MESERHREQMNLLIESLQHALRDRDDAYVGGNMAMYYSARQAQKHDFRAPDVFVVLDTHRGERKRWVLWEEDLRAPDVVIELTSEATEEDDRGRKQVIYERLLRVPVYLIYDPFSARLDAFRLDLARRRYERIEPDARGSVECAPLGLHLGIVPGVRKQIDAPWLRWIDRDGRILPAPDERADAEARRADTEAERARQEAERARQEAERADRAETELARLRAELRRRDG